MQGMGGEKMFRTQALLQFGDISHIVINCAHVKKADDHVYHRHEKIGTQKYMMILTVRTYLRTSTPMTGIFVQE